MPGIGEEMDGAMQHAPQPRRQFKVVMLVSAKPVTRSAVALAQLGIDRIGVRAAAMPQLECIGGGFHQHA